MRLFIIVVFLGLSICTFANETSTESNTTINHEKLIKTEFSDFNTNFNSDILLPDRKPPKCDWSDCVDGCESSRKYCLKNNSSSKCGPRYDSCKKGCNKRCN
jgi:hypothetical protein